MARTGRRAGVGLLGLVLLTVTLAGCTSAGPEGATDVQVDPDALALWLGESGTATVAVGSGFRGEVALTASGVPPEVQVAFDPAELAGGGSSTMTVTAGADAGEGDSGFTVHASADGTSASADVALTVTGREVEGRLTDRHGIGGVPGVSVALGDETVVTDAEGRFAFTGVAVPYDLTTFDAAAGWLHQIRGLRTLEPSLISHGDLGTGPGGGSSASVTGTLSTPPGPGEVTFVCIEGSGGVGVFGCAEVANPESTYSINALWRGSADVGGTARAVTYQVDADNLATGIAATGTTAVTLSDGVPSVADLTMNGPTDAITFHVDVSVPPGFVPAAAVVQRTMGEADAVAAPIATSGAGSYEVVAPEIDGAGTLILSGTTIGLSEAYAWTQDHDEGHVALEVPAPPALTQPVNGAVGVAPGTTFGIDAGDDTVNTFLLVHSVAGPRITITTLEESFDLPDFGTFSTALALTSGSYDWTAYSAGPVGDDPDAALGASAMQPYFRLLSARSGYGTGPGGDAHVSVGAPRIFDVD